MYARSRQPSPMQTITYCPSKARLPQLGQICLCRPPEGKFGKGPFNAVLSVRAPRLWCRGHGLRKERKGAFEKQKEKKKFSPFHLSLFFYFSWLLARGLGAAKRSSGLGIFTWLCAWWQACRLLHFRNDARCFQRCQGVVRILCSRSLSAAAQGHSESH